MDELGGVFLLGGGILLLDQLEKVLSYMMTQGLP